MLLKRCGLALLLILVVLTSSGMSAREMGEATRIKAAIVFNLTKFVSWPDSAAQGATFLIEVVGEDPADPDFGMLADKQVKGQALEVRSLDRGGDQSSGRIVFISTSDGDRLEEILAEVAGQPVLTVSELDRFCERGGMIQIYEQRNKVRMRINRGVAQSAGLGLSSQLLKVAELVGEGD